ncbi:MAG: 2-(1,2-epoxy-1,2-dihydrophenyl)acetyl-CoA isomerase PaaG [Pseudomonadota bacterium]
METVLRERNGAVLRLTLNRPERLNSFNEEMHAALRRDLASVNEDPTIRAIILTGAGRGFCAGQDLSERIMAGDDAPPDLGDTLGRLYNPLVLGLRNAPVPVVAAINGVAAGAGLNIALACDIQIAARSATFLEPFANLGLIPDAGGTFTLPRAVGGPRARAMAMLAEKVDAATAEEWGLVWRTVDDAALEETAQDIAQRLADLPTEGLVSIRHAFDTGAVNDLASQLDLERDVQRERGRHQDYKEGVDAFTQKRRPKFAKRP